MDGTRALGRSLRDHPVPVALVGLGLGWLLALALRNPDGAGQRQGVSQTGRYGRGRVDLYGNPYRPQGDSSPGHGADLAAEARAAGAGLQRIGGEGEDAFLGRVDAARGAVLGVLRQAGEAAAAFRERVEQALAAAAGQARRVGDRVVSIAAGAGQAGGPGSRTASYLQGQPLLLGAVGVAAGAALGLLLPSGRSERRMLGRAREGVRDSAQTSIRAAGQQVAGAAGRVRAVVAETAAAGHEAVKRGLSATEPPERTRPGDPSAAATSPAAEGGPPRP